MNIIETFQNRIGMTLATFVAVAVGIFTQVTYQNVAVPTLISFFETMMGESNKDVILITWGANLLSAAFLGIVGWLWIREAIKGDYWNDSNEVIARVTSAATGLACIVYAAVFAEYIFTSLLGIVIAVAIGMFLLMSSNKK
ncbi:hypothetical protein HN020_14985 [Brevibacillus borstelensis]|jgi:hypothetical protein|uniref:hypothetical protein n=1 Tax=Brevibacillus borstelensis TaxID=45462 RepID=UPI0014907CB8|nr:hypothetical protein [Brevibacillus borstelensis]MCM3625602.1 hypothetical protein [Brevibacillus borstelensis]NOU56035.1 hypothetical protein [Brevibacillus borstelensis]